MIGKALYRALVTAFIYGVLMTILYPIFGWDYAEVPKLTLILCVCVFAADIIVESLCGIFGKGTR